MEKNKPIDPVKAESTRLWREQQKAMLGNDVYNRYEADRKKRER